MGSKADTTFIQVAESQSSQQRRKVATILKHTAMKSHNVHLALIASQVSAGATWHFDKLIENVDKMIEKLRSEEQDDIDKKDWCDSERNNSNSQNAQLEDDNFESVF